MQRIAEHRGVAHSRRSAARRSIAPPSGSHSSSSKSPLIESRLSSVGVPSATSRAAIHQREPIAVFRLVHVVGRDENRHAFGAHLLDQFPELPARDRIDARRRLVEKDDRRPMQHRASQRQPLLPSAGECAGQARFAPASPAISSAQRDSLVELVAHARRTGRRRSADSRPRSDRCRARTSATCSRCCGESAPGSRRRRMPATARGRRSDAAIRTGCGSWSICPRRWARGSRTPRRGASESDIVDRGERAEALDQVSTSTE